MKLFKPTYLFICQGILLCSLCISFCLGQQYSSTQDIIRLTDGTLVYGELLEEVAGEGYEFKRKDGVYLFYTLDQVDEVRRGVPKNTGSRQNSGASKSSSSSSSSSSYSSRLSKGAREISLGGMRGLNHGIDYQKDTYPDINQEVLNVRFLAASNPNKSATLLIVHGWDLYDDQSASMSFLSGMRIRLGSEHNTLRLILDGLWGIQMGGLSIETTAMEDSDGFFVGFVWESAAGITIDMGRSYLCFLGGYNRQQIYTDYTDKRVGHIFLRLGLGFH